MFKKRTNRDEANDLAGDEPGGWISSILAEEEGLDRRALWRLGSWGVGTVGAVIIGILATQSPVSVQRAQLAAAEAQSQQVQWIAKESQNKARQLAAAVDTLNSDRDRLYARVTVLEENLESVTGSIARQQKTIANPPATASSPQAAASPTPAPVVADTTATVQPETKPPSESKPSLLPKIAPVASVANPPPNPSSGVAAVEQKATAAEPEKKHADNKDTPVTGALASKASRPDEVVESKPVQQTAFGVELGGANSVEGLRAIWRSALKSNESLFATLQPIVVLREGNDGLGMKLRLVAGPLNDVAAAAKICAVLIENKRSCLPSVYDGQRLAMKDEKKPDAKAAPAKKRTQQPTPAATSGGSSFSSIFGFR